MKIILQLYIPTSKNYLTVAPHSYIKKLSDSCPFLHIKIIFKLHIPTYKIYLTGAHSY